MREISVTASVRSLMDLLEQRTGQILSDGRMWRIEASLGPVLRARGFASLDALVDAIRNERGDALATEQDGNCLGKHEPTRHGLAAEVDEHAGAIARLVSW
mgnify:CR=1 FL=1